MTLANETKNSASFTNQDRPSGLTWDDANWTWDEAQNTWDLPIAPLSKQTKNSTSFSNGTKN